MAGSIRLLIVMVGACFLASCQKIQQYRLPPAPLASQAEESLGEPPFRLSWMEPRHHPRDLPIVFVASSHKDEWDKLDTFWNLSPQPAAGMRTVYLGLPPLQALAAIVLAEHHETIKIKVPLGLPDPTTHVPRTNLPTFGKWKLGKQLFFERLIPVGDEYYSCATCHMPENGFSDASRHPLGGTINTLGLINVVFWREPFWDGRVRALEETLVHDFEDEREPFGTAAKERAKKNALHHHLFGGFVRDLVEEGRYNQRFQEVFGVENPTQDTVVRALATYLRTILAGNSLFDRADQLRRDKKAERLGAEHFDAVLDKTTEAILQDDYAQPRKRADMPALLVKGYELFQGKARCAQCHFGPLFTDHDYHNVGYPDLRGEPAVVGKETGRSVYVPLGQKESRFLGAYRTPSLRNLVKTKPYFHHGSLATLRSVIEFYDYGIMPSQHLALPLRDREREFRLNLSKEDADALVMFLRALEGSPVDGTVAAPR